MRNTKFLAPLLCIALAGCAGFGAAEQETTTVITTASETSETAETSGTEITEGWEVTFFDTGTVEELEDEEVSTTTKETLPPEPKPDTEDMAKFTAGFDELFGDKDSAANEFFVQGARKDLCQRLENFTEGIVLNGWTVANEGYASEQYRNEEASYELYRYKITITLDVAESDNPYITEGTDDYLFVYEPSVGKCWQPVRKVGETVDDSLRLPSYSSDKRYAEFCNDFTFKFADIYPGDDVADFSAPDLSLASSDRWLQDSAICSVVRYCPDGTWAPMPYATFDEGLQTLFGFSADVLDIKNSVFYDAETDTVSVEGHGDGWYYGYISGDEVTDGVHVLTIDYFEDEFSLVLSQRYRYTVRENEDGSLTLLRMERLYTSERDIFSGSV